MYKNGRNSNFDNYQPKGNYASANHNHSGVYQPAGSYAPASHNHDGRYYTESEINEKIKINTWLPSDGYNPFTNDQGFFCYSVNPSLMVAQKNPSGFSEYATVFGIGKGTEYGILMYMDVFGKLAIWNKQDTGWVIAT